MLLLRKRSGGAEATVTQLESWGKEGETPLAVAAARHPNLLFF